MRSNCFLFTDLFPYGNGEVFVEKEIPYLCRFYKNVYIIPLRTESSGVRQIPHNAQAINIFGKESLSNVRFSNIKILLKIFPILFYELKFQWKDMFNDLKWNLSVLKTNYLRAICLIDFIETKQFDFKNSNLVSYWFDSSALILSIVKSMNNDFEFYSRAHGFDLYKEQARRGYHPFKNFMLFNASRVFAVSKKGCEYLKFNYPQFSSRFDYAYLGSEETDMSIFPAINAFHIVSCAYISEIKRLSLIPEVLKCLPLGFKVKWTHIGGGEGFQELKLLTQNLPVNIEVNLTGELLKDNVTNFYLNNQVSLFLSVSRSEGLPYSMMEAISYGIPLMSTNVGGCSEICNEHTGVLIEKDFQPKEVAEKILAFSASRMNTPEFRKGVRKFWEEHFNAEKNYEKFYLEISK